MDGKTSVFLDTNIIQTFWDSRNGAEVFLGVLGIKQEYYKLVDFIERNALGSLVEICIPEVVVLEMKYHMLTGFIKQSQRLDAQIKENKKVFGNLIDFTAVEIKYHEKEYEEYIDSLFDEFFSTPKNYTKQIPFPRQAHIMDTLVNKAMHGVRPFFTGKIGSKNHSDAGFKDSVIAETIYEYSNANDNLCIFVTQDHDFSSEFRRTIQQDSNLVLFPSIEVTIEALTEYYGTDPLIRLQREFTENIYWHEYLLNESGMSLDESVSEIKVDDVLVYEDNVFIIWIHFVVNEVKYIFSVKFDNAANDIVGVDYYTEND